MQIRTINHDEHWLYTSSELSLGYLMTFSQLRMSNSVKQKRDFDCE
jgi:hypothetical protein